MAVINDTQFPTLLDWSKRLDPDGKIADVVEILEQMNPILEDMVYVEGNLPTGHRTTIRSGLPEATWRKLNYGVQPSKAKTVQVTDACGMLEAYSDIDKALVELNGGKADFRFDEDKAHLNAIADGLAQGIFYSNEALTPEAITGFAPRYDSTTAENGVNIFDAGGTSTTNTSIWLVCWGKNTVHGIYPKGSKAGLEIEDLGQQTRMDASGGMYEVYRTHFKQYAGLCVRDWRYAARIANVDVNLLINGTSSQKAQIQKDILTLMIEAEEAIPSLSLGRPVFYMNRTVRTALRFGILNNISYQLTWETVAGKRVMMFDGIPVKRCDALLGTEAQVV